ncbi:MAG TPA: dTDP-glucose 4,6-dehydratase [Bacteroidia bacterium]|nr:dTDP-glucose 4,6-dehydratase [Bacteroidia bacterium]
MPEKKILITGGAGFIGSHVVRLFVNKYPGYHIYNLDKLTYAGNLKNLTDIEDKSNYTFIKGDIVDGAAMKQLFDEHRFDGVLHLAAESHVDRSITNPLDFVQTNIIGTVNLLNAARDVWKADGMEGKLFYHISTDEVYGSLDDGGFFTEETPYDPQSPYSASKAGSDHFVRAYSNTYKLPIVITNCSNNYGPNQFPEKLIPLCINNILNNKPLPIYGKGENVRDWLYVVDHARAIDVVFHHGKMGETYNIGGFNEWMNIDLVKVICKVMDKKLGKPEGASEQLITYVTDRAGHDLRYAIDAHKIMKELGWEPSLQFEEGIEKTVDWYLANRQWMQEITSGDYLNYYKEMYAGR